MSAGTEPTPIPPEPEGLQFDRAEFGPEATARRSPALACSACSRPIDDAYYEINGTIFCEPCRRQIEAHLKGGSAPVRWLKALGLGALASLAGSAIYAALIHFFNIEAGIVSVFCGYLIGRAVRKGSGGRGGAFYQLMAVGLTYLSIGVAYAAVTFAAHGVENMPVPGPVAPPGANPQPAPAVNPGAVVAFFAVISVISPVFVARTNIISAIIIGFALWTAWRQTRKAKVVVTGPYRVGEGPASFGEPGHA